MSEPSVKPAETPRIKRVPDLDVDEELIQTQVLMPKGYMKKLDALSSLKEMSKGALVRTAIGEYLERQETVIETPKGAKVSNKVVKDLLRACTTYYGNFEVEGEKGFIALCKEKGVKLKDLTYEQFGVVADKLRIGYNGYVVKPSVDEFIGKLSVLEPTEEQKDLLREALGGGGGGHSGEEEEDWEEEEEGEKEEEGEEGEEW